MRPEVIGGLPVQMKILIGGIVVVGLVAMLGVAAVLFWH